MKVAHQLLLAALLAISTTAASAATPKAATEARLVAVTVEVDTPDDKLQVVVAGQVLGHFDARQRVVHVPSGATVRVVSDGIVVDEWLVNAIPGSNLYWRPKLTWVRVENPLPMDVDVRCGDATQLERVRSMGVHRCPAIGTEPLEVRVYRPGGEALHGRRYPPLGAQTVTWTLEPPPTGVLGLFGLADVDAVVRVDGVETANVPAHARGYIYPKVGRRHVTATGPDGALLLDEWVNVDPYETRVLSVGDGSAPVTRTRAGR